MPWIPSVKWGWFLWWVRPSGGSGRLVGQGQLGARARHLTARAIVALHSSHRCPPTLAVAGINRYPRKITKAMPAEKKSQRGRIKAFMRMINVNHLMPTRYELTDVEFKGLTDTVKNDKDSRREKLLHIKSEFEKRFQAQGKKGLKQSKHTNDAGYFFARRRPWTRCEAAAADSRW